MKREGGGEAACLLSGSVLVFPSRLGAALRTPKHTTPRTAQPRSTHHHVGHESLENLISYAVASRVGGSVGCGGLALDLFDVIVGN